MYINELKIKTEFMIELSSFVRTNHQINYFKLQVQRLRFAIYYQYFHYFLIYVLYVTTNLTPGDTTQIIVIILYISLEKYPFLKKLLNLITNI